MNFLCLKSNFFPRKKHRFTDVLKFLPKLYREKSLVNSVAGTWNHGGDRRRSNGIKPLEVELKKANEWSLEQN